MQSNVFERSVDNAPLIACLSKHWRHCLPQQKDKAVHYILGEVRIGFLKLFNSVICTFDHIYIFHQILTN